MPHGPKRNVLFTLVLSFILLSGQIALAAQEPFPVYECITPNVDFWVKVYTQYTTSQGLMHDSTDLSIIYEVLDLKPFDAPGARKINRKRIKAAKNTYQKILNGLARNPDADDRDSRRVADLFGRPTSGDIYSRAAGNLRCQIGQKDRFQAGLIRSGAYIDRIKTIFKSYGLPEDLAYLPHVESSFNPNAYSKFGAAGMWQFTRSTGKRFMKVGYELDERRDPIQSAHAAARLLRENHAKLGNWPLAITAYNHGAAGMLKAKQQYKNYSEIFSSYRSRIFKFASRNFYSEFLAARSVADNYQTYFGDLVLDQPNPVRTITLEGYVAFEDICRHFGISPGQVKMLNPALRTPVFNGQKHIPEGYVLRLPMPSSLNAQIEDTVLTIPDALFHSEQKPSRFYTVQRGDTAGRIARLHGVPLSDLILANNLNHRATIYPRQTLRIPLPGEPVKKESKPVLIAAAPSVDVTETQIAVTPPSAQPDAQSDAQPDAQPAVQLDDQPNVQPNAKPNAKEDQTSPEKQETTYPNALLATVIPIGNRPADETADTAVNEQSPRTEPSLEIVTADVQIEEALQIDQQPIGIIRVEVEETLGHYAEWAQVRTWEIRRLNNLSYGQLLHLHQKVKIPLTHTTAAKFVENRYEYHKRLQEDFFAVYQIGDLQEYTVRRGDNYWALCRDRFDIPLWLLKHCNPEIDLANLRFHQKIWIPNIEKITPDAAPETPVDAPPEDPDELPADAPAESPSDAPAEDMAQV